MKPINSSLLNKLADLVSKPSRKDKDSDVLMGVGVKVLKNGPNIGKMVGLFRGVSNTSAGAQLRNGMLARPLATADDIRNLFMTRGMTVDQANTALDNVRVIGRGFSAVDVKTKISEFETDSTQAVQARFLPDGDASKL